MDDAFGADFTALGPSELVEELRGLAAVANRLVGLRARVLAATEETRLTGGFGGTRTTAELLATAGPVTPVTARREVELALALTAGRTLTGDPLEPVAPVTADALAAGVVSGEQARVIVETLEKVPAWLNGEQRVTVESTLVQAAVVEHPVALAQTARALLARLDQDGPEPVDEPAPPVLAGLRFTRRRGGVQRMSVDLSVADAALVRAVLDPLSAPRPVEHTGSDPDGGAGGGKQTQPDPRSAGDRGRDALLEVFGRVLRSGSLPSSGGVPVTVLATVSLPELMAGRGVARTERGGAWPVPELLEHASEAEIIPIITDKWGAVLCLGRSIRLASGLQRRVLAARDRGCCFPGCTRPASWCQVHHVVEWLFGGATDIDNLCLLCPYHHRNFGDWGWQIRMINKLPRWIPPEWIDPQRRPVRNTAHHPPDLHFADPTT